MREEFLANPQVVELACWLAKHLPAMPVRLDMPHSSFVPGGIHAHTTFGELVPYHFRWRLGGTAIGDWYETSQRLGWLARQLREAVAHDDAEATQRACREIADWGADRNARVGASAFVLGLGARLPDYLRRTRLCMRLSSPDPAGEFRRVQRMNSTLSKIHALHASDGLPIYESRIAAAIAVLVEAWRRDTGRHAEPLDPALRFPAVGRQCDRRVERVFAHAVDPGVLAYASTSEIATARRWADATVRLGLLMEATLHRADPLFCVAWPADPALATRPARMAAFAASLFVAGYDPACLRPATALHPG